MSIPYKPLDHIYLDAPSWMRDSCLLRKSCSSMSHNVAPLSSSNYVCFCFGFDRPERRESIEAKVSSTGAPFALATSWLTKGSIRRFWLLADKNIKCSCCFANGYRLTWPMRFMPNQAKKCRSQNLLKWPVNKKKNTHGLWGSCIVNSSFSRLPNNTKNSVIDDIELEK